MTDVKCDNAAAIEAWKTVTLKAKEATKKVKAQLSAAKMTIRLLEAQIAKLDGRGVAASIDTVRTANALATIKNARRWHKGETVPAELMDLITEDLTEVVTLQIEHKG